MNKVCAILTFLTLLAGCSVMSPGNGRYPSIEDFHCPEKTLAYCVKRSVDTAYCECVDYEEAERRRVDDLERVNKRMPR